MNLKLPTANTEILESDRRGGWMRVFAPPWWDWAYSVTQAVIGLQSSSGGGTPGTFTFTQSDVILGRHSAGGGPGEEITFTDQAQALADDTSFAQMRTTLGLGSIATQNADDVAITGGSIGGIDDLALADGGTGSSLADPGADRILFWDDSTGAVTWLTPGTNIAIAGTTLNASGSVTATGGSLTANAVVLGAGTTDTKVAPGIATDGTSVVTLGVAGTSVGGVDLKNGTSGTISLRPPTGALGTVTVTVPAVTDTLVGKATTDTLTNKTLTSPTLTTPVLGTPSSGNLANCTGLPVAGGGTGVASLTAYAPVFGGTTSTAPVQSGAVGTTGQVLMSNGAGALPTFQTLAGSSAYDLYGAISALTPMAWWKCNETSGTTLADSSGNSYTLTLSGSAGTAYNLAQSRQVPTNADKYLCFLATSSKASRTGTIGFTAPITGDWTVFGICTPLVTGTTGNVAQIFAMGANGETTATNAQMHVLCVTGIMGTLWEQGAGVNIVTASLATPAIGKTSCWTVVKDGTANTVQYYLNGVKWGAAVGYSTEPDGGSDPGMETSIGANIDGISSSPMIVSNVAVWGSKLTDAQIYNLAIQAGLAN